MGEWTEASFEPNYAKRGGILIKYLVERVIEKAITFLQLYLAEYRYLVYFLAIFVTLYIIIMHWMNIRLFNKMRRFTAVICLLIELAAIVFFTVLFRDVREASIYEFDFLWSYKKWIFEKNVYYGMEIINNILLFFPLGFILTDVYKRCPLWIAVSHAFIISGCVEIGQYIWKIGLFEFDDMLSNVLGAAAGWMVFHFLNFGAYLNDDYD